jgi:hypothetical protein
MLFTRTLCKYSPGGSIYKNYGLGTQRHGIKCVARCLVIIFWGVRAKMFKMPVTLITKPGENCTFFVGEKSKYFLSSNIPVISFTAMNNVHVIIFES